MPVPPVDVDGSENFDQLVALDENSKDDQSYVINHHMNVYEFYQTKTFFL